MERFGNWKVTTIHHFTFSIGGPNGVISLRLAKIMEAANPMLNLAGMCGIDKLHHSAFVTLRSPRNPDESKIVWVNGTQGAITIAEKESNQSIVGLLNVGIPAADQVTFKEFYHVLTRDWLKEGHQRWVLDRNCQYTTHELIPKAANSKVSSLGDSWTSLVAPGCAQYAFWGLTAYSWRMIVNPTWVDYTFWLLAAGYFLRYLWRRWFK